MGTRGLTCVVHNGCYRIAQYGQWDHYPSGQGLTALRFARSWLTNPQKREQFIESLDRIEYQEYPDLLDLRDRDHGAEILTLVAESKSSVLLELYPEFGGDSLFCEWAYVLDLDTNAFEVYKGSNQDPEYPRNRFSVYDSPDDDYRPVLLVKSYEICNLPSDDDFVQDLT